MSAMPKGCKFYGDFHHQPGEHTDFLYRLPDKKFIIVKKAPYSGKVISVSDPIEGRLIERFDVINLGYTVVSCYRFKQVAAE